MRNKKKLCAGILMLLLLTGCSSQEVLQEVPQTIVLPESQIDTMPVQETAAAENDNTESFSLLEEGGSRFAYESLDEQEQIWYQEIEQRLGLWMTQSNCPRNRWNREWMNRTLTKYFSAC